MNPWSSDRAALILGRMNLSPTGLPCDVCGQALSADDEIVAIPDGLTLISPQGRCVVGIPGQTPPNSVRTKPMHRGCVLAYIDGLFAQTAAGSRGKDPLANEPGVWHFDRSDGVGFVPVECIDCGFVGCVDIRFTCKRCNGEICPACKDSHRCTD